jgi:hypothetical protein
MCVLVKNSVLTLLPSIPVDTVSNAKNTDTDSSEGDNGINLVPWTLQPKWRLAGRLEIALVLDNMVWSIDKHGY